MAKEVMVVKRDILFEDSDFQGLISIEKRDYLQIILDNYEYVLRDDKLEANTELKQIIPYVVIINPKTKKVFGYKRFKKMPGLHEMRLHDRFSIGLGGHIDREEEKVDVISDAAMRELAEEVRMVIYPRPKVVGFVNDELDSVGSVHFGVVAIAETEEEVTKTEGDEVRDEKFYSIEEVDDLFSKGVEMDGWTRICWPFIKKHLLTL
jgi:predicted NUDIX family phosphoesterase